MLLTMGQTNVDSNILYLSLLTYCTPIHVIRYIHYMKWKKIYKKIEYNIHK